MLTVKARRVNFDPFLRPIDYGTRNKDLKLRKVGWVVFGLGKV